VTARSYREIFTSKTFGDKDDRYLALWLVAHASWRDCTVSVAGHRVKLKRGQAAYTVRFLAEAAELPRSTVHRRLQRMQDRGFIKLESNKGCVRITVLNYEAYQTEDDGRPQLELIPDEPALSVPQKTKPKDPTKQMMEVWNEVCGGTLRKCNALGTQRKKHMAARFKDTFNDIEAWRLFCQRIVASDFLTNRTGNNRNNFKADLDWCVKPDNCNKITEGKYDNQQGQWKPEQDATPYQKALAQWYRNNREGPKPKAEDYDNRGEGLGREAGSTGDTRPVAMGE